MPKHLQGAYKENEREFYTAFLSISYKEYFCALPNRIIYNICLRTRRNIMQENIIKKDHNIIIENRKSMTVSGITDVDSFDEKAICLYTQLGELTVQGRELHIDSMSVETGDMTITGDIWAVIYGDRDRKGPLSALGRLFR